MDETEEQTKRIHERQRLLRTERGLALRQEADGDLAPPLERAAPARAAAGGDPLRGQARLPLPAGCDAARPRPLPEPDRGLGLPAPAPARAAKAVHRRPLRGLRRRLRPRRRGAGRHPVRPQAAAAGAYTRVRDAFPKEQRRHAPRDPEALAHAGFDRAALAAASWSTSST